MSELNCVQAVQSATRIFFEEHGSREIREEIKLLRSALKTAQSALDTVRGQTSQLRENAKYEEHKYHEQRARILDPVRSVLGSIQSLGTVLTQLSADLQSECERNEALSAALTALAHSAGLTRASNAYASGARALSTASSKLKESIARLSELGKRLADRCASSSTSSGSSGGSDGTYRIDAALGSEFARWTQQAASIYHEVIGLVGNLRELSSIPLAYFAYPAATSSASGAQTKPAAGSAAKDFELRLENQLRIQVVYRIDELRAAMEGVLLQAIRVIGWPATPRRIPQLDNGPISQTIRELYKYLTNLHAAMIDAIFVTKVCRWAIHPRSDDPAQFDSIAILLPVVAEAEGTSPLPCPNAINVLEPLHDSENEPSTMPQDGSPNPRVQALIPWNHISSIPWGNKPFVKSIQSRLEFFFGSSGLTEFKGASVDWVQKYLQETIGTHYSLFKTIVTSDVPLISSDLNVAMIMIAFGRRGIVPALLPSPITAKELWHKYENGIMLFKGLDMAPYDDHTELVASSLNGVILEGDAQILSPGIGHLKLGYALAQSPLLDALLTASRRSSLGILHTNKTGAEQSVWVAMNSSRVVPYTDIPSRPHEATLVFDFAHEVCASAIRVIRTSLLPQWMEMDMPTFFQELSGLLSVDALIEEHLEHQASWDFEGTLRASFTPTPPVLRSTLDARLDRIRTHGMYPGLSALFLSPSTFSQLINGALAFAEARFRSALEDSNAWQFIGGGKAVLYITKKANNPQSIQAKAFPYVTLALESNFRMFEKLLFELPSVEARAFSLENGLANHLKYVQALLKKRLRAAENCLSSYLGELATSKALEASTKYDRVDASDLPTHLLEQWLQSDACGDSAVDMRSEGLQPDDWETVEEMASRLQKLLAAAEEHESIPEETETQAPTRPSLSAAATAILYHASRMASSAASASAAAFSGRKRSSSTTHGKMFGLSKLIQEHRQEQLQLPSGALMSQSPIARTILASGSNIAEPSATDPNACIFRILAITSVCTKVIQLINSLREQPIHVEALAVRALEYLRRSAEALIPFMQEASVENLTVAKFERSFATSLKLPPLGPSSESDETSSMQQVVWRTFGFSREEHDESYLANQLGLSQMAHRRLCARLATIRRDLAKDIPMWLIYLLSSMDISRLVHLATLGNAINIIADIYESFIPNADVPGSEPQDVSDLLFSSVEIPDDDAMYTAEAARSPPKGMCRAVTNFFQSLAYAGSGDWATQGPLDQLVLEYRKLLKECNSAIRDHVISEFAAATTGFSAAIKQRAHAEMESLARVMTIVDQVAQTDSGSLEDETYVHGTALKLRRFLHQRQHAWSRGELDRCVPSSQAADAMVVLGSRILLTQSFSSPASANGLWAEVAQKADEHIANAWFLAVPLPRSTAIQTTIDAAAVLACLSQASPAAVALAVQQGRSEDFPSLQSGTTTLVTEAIVCQQFLGLPVVFTLGGGWVADYVLKLFIAPYATKTITVIGFLSLPAGARILLSSRILALSERGLYDRLPNSLNRDEWTMLAKLYSNAKQDSAFELRDGLWGGWDESELQHWKSMGGVEPESEGTHQLNNHRQSVAPTTEKRQYQKPAVVPPAIIEEPINHDDNDDNLNLC